MLSTFRIVAVLAAVFPSLATASPVVTPVLNRDSNHFDPTLGKRDSNMTVLSPVSKYNLSKSSAAAFPDLTSRQKSGSSVTPQASVILRYESISSLAMLAQVNATMKVPSVLLEDIASVTHVDCADSYVAVTFSESADYLESLAAWSNSTFIMFTNHLGDCDPENERGLYLVDSIASKDATLTITASSIKSGFDSSADELAISWLKPAATTISKRDLLSTILNAFPTSISLTQGDVTETLSITASDTSLTGSFDMSGYLHYDFSEAKFTKFYIDLDLAVDAATNIDVTAKITYDSDVYTYSPLDVSVSAFEITGILSVGPQLSFELGVEVAASGTVEISADVTATLSDGHVYLDLLNSSNAATSGWTPIYTHETNISAAIEAQVNPYVMLTAEIGIDFLNGLLDLSTGVTLKPELINVFDITGQFDISNNDDITFPASTDKVCANSLWFSSDFVFTVTAFVTQFYTVSLYEVEIPLYESGCWSWLTLGNSTGSA